MSPEPTPGSVLPPGLSDGGSCEVWGELQRPISASSFLPPHVPCGKPWNRVQVPALGRPRLSKIWKRVGGLSLGLEDPAYLTAAEELESQTSRKRVRGSRYVPCLSYSIWDTRASSIRDGRQDLELGQASVFAAEEEAATAAKQVHCLVRSKQSAFPDVKWVPKKRDSARWPIERGTSTAIKRAALCPPTDFGPQVKAGREAPTEQARHGAKKERVTRRASRRISILAEDLQGDQGTPTRRTSLPQATTPLLSPLKRLFATPSLTTVANSPMKGFRFSATPLHVVAQSPPESQSPDLGGLESSPVLARTVSEENIRATSPLVFDQPLPEKPTVSKQESKRRVSLHAALGSDRSVSFSSRLAQSGASGNLPNRRQSLISVPRDVKPRSGRRHTMAAFSLNGAPEPVNSQQEPENEGESLEISVLSETAKEATAQDSTVVVDLGTNLDIFGQGSQIAPPLKHEQELSEEVMRTPSQPRKNRHDFLLTSTPGRSPTLREVLVDDNTATIQSAAKVGTACVDAQQAALTPGTPAPARAAHELSGVSDVETAVGVQVEISSAYNKRGSLSMIDEERTLDISGQPLRLVESEEMLALASSTSASNSQSGMERETDLVRSETGTLDDKLPFQLSVSVGHAIKESSVTDSEAASDQDGQPDFQLPGAEHNKEERQAVNSPTPSDDTVRTPEDGWCGTVTFDASALENEAINGVPVEAIPESNVGFAPSEPVSSLEKSLSPGPPSTPPLATAAIRAERNASTAADAEVIFETPPGGSPGFTPINGNTPPRSSPSQLAAKRYDEEVKLDDSCIQAGGEETTVVIGLSTTTSNDYTEEYNDGTTVADEDATENLELYAVEEEGVPDKTIAVHDDSETEMLRRFVTRVKADKSAKAATSTSSLTRRKLRPQRRSGSTGSTATSAGSPVGKSESPSNRRPLSERDRNSPSPRKKRKPDEGDHIFKGKPIFASEEPSPQPRQKRRRKRLDAELETTLESSIAQIDDPHGDSADGGPRRSTRARTTRVALKPTTHSANSVISMIPVRLPGQAGMLGDINIESNLAAARHRSEEKDLAALTRVNTRKNKANSVPAKMVLARQAEDPAWRMKELKGVFDAVESREAESTEKGPSPEDHKSRKDNRVRWAETLATYQEESASSGASARSNAAAEVADEIIDEPAGPLEVGTDQVSEQPEKSVAKQATRRTRGSRLQTPTPVKRASIADPEPAVRIPAQPPKSTSSSARGMATRRTKIASLGMSVNGTPAPKRRARA